MRDDVVQLVSDTHPFLANLLAGAFHLGGPLTFRLLSQSGHITAAGGNAVADEPCRRQRHEAFHRLHDQRRGPVREGRIDDRPAQDGGCHHGSGDRHPSRQPRGGQVHGEPDQDGERQRRVAQDHDQSSRSGRHRQHGQRPAS
jgi:hypothetical protein